MGTWADHYKTKTRCENNNMKEYPQCFVKRIKDIFSLKSNWIKFLLFITIIASVKP